MLVRNITAMGGVSTIFLTHKWVTPSCCRK